MLGNLCMVTGGANLGRVAMITKQERHPGSFDVAHVKDANGNSFAIQLSNNFVIGTDNGPWISSSWKVSASASEERDRQPNRAVYKMISR